MFSTSDFLISCTTTPAACTPTIMEATSRSRNSVMYFLSNTFKVEIPLVSSSVIFNSSGSISIISPTVRLPSLLSVKVLYLPKAFRIPSNLLTVMGLLFAYSSNTSLPLTLGEIGASTFLTKVTLSSVL